MMIISWNVTRACNLKCKHCYRDAGAKDSNELSTQEARDLLEEIARAGFKIVILSGGEPLLRGDIYELISFACRLDLIPVLGTNGTLINQAVAKRLKEAGLKRAGISLDSVDSEIHDEFRQQNGAWKRTIQGMQACKGVGLDFQIHTTVTQYNWEETEQVTDLACQLGACAHHIFFLVPTGRGKEIEDAIISSQDYETLLRRILEKQKTVNLELKPVCAPQFVRIAEQMNLNIRFQRGCLAGLSYCCILPNGDVHPCPYLPIRLGNVRELKFSRIWQENDVLKRLRSLDYKGRCAQCGYKDSCGGCRARAYHHSGDYMDEDPVCRL
jgi:putative heme d1 biosynthesis radical SAM protein NirJ2